MELQNYIDELISLVCEKQKEYESLLKKAVITVNCLIANDIQQQEIISITCRIKSVLKTYMKIQMLYNKGELKKELSKMLLEKDLTAIEDFLAVRIIAETEDECKQIIAILRENFKIVTGSYDNFIDSPRNGYQSLHITILFNELPIEFQIKTYLMHRNAEFGPAKHTEYNKKRYKDVTYCYNRFRGNLREPIKFYFNQDTEDFEDINKYDSKVIGCYK